MIKVSISSDPMEIGLLELFHKVAKENGSEFRIGLYYDTCHNEIYCKYPINNNTYTKGYFAILYLIDSVENSIATTNPGHNGRWFNVSIKDEQKLVKYLLD